MEYQLDYSNLHLYIHILTHPPEYMFSESSAHFQCFQHKDMQFLERDPDS